MLLLLLGAAALAATPTPDRPSASRSGYLVAPNTLELEAGLAWHDGARAAPATVKYAFGEVLEARMSANLAAFDAAPGLEAGLKARIVGDENLGLAFFAASAVPTASWEPWYGTAQGLLTVPIDRSSVQVNAGVNLVGTRGGVAFGGIPVALLVGTTFGKSFSAFAEVAANVGGPACDGACGGLVDGGLGWLLTDILQIDAGLGWDLDHGAPIVQTGLTANLGRFRAL